MHTLRPSVGYVSTHKRHAERPLTAVSSVDAYAVPDHFSGITTKRQSAMFRHAKFRQAGLIVFATTLLLILPNMSRLFG